MSQQAWQSIAEPATEAAARILLGLLQSESIPARLRSNVPVPGLGVSFIVEVPDADASRAKTLLDSRPVDEDELAAIALSTPGPESG